MPFKATRDASRTSRSTGSTTRATAARACPRRGACLYKDERRLVDARRPPPGAYGVERNRFNVVDFAPVATSALRIELVMQDGFCRHPGMVHGPACRNGGWRPRRPWLNREGRSPRAVGNPGRSIRRSERWDRDRRGLARALLRARAARVYRPPSRAAHLGAIHRRVLEAADRTQSHGHHPAHPEAERADGASGELRARGEEGAGRAPGQALQRHRRLQADRGGVLHARRRRRPRAGEAARRADGDRRRRAGTGWLPLHRAHGRIRRSRAPGAGRERWSSLHTSHELYNAGHMYEAAVAHFEATGKRTLLDVAIRNANLVCDVFGPGKTARRARPPGDRTGARQAVEGDRRLPLPRPGAVLPRSARTSCTRVTPPRFGPKDPFNIYNDLEYRQDHMPVVDQTRVTGHSVRATYMLAGMTDVATLWPDADWGRTLDAAWQDVVSKRMYLTGGLGSKGETEAFGDDYVLPNLKAYTETCASIGGMLWYHRMFLREGDAKHLDVLRAHPLQRLPVRGLAGWRHLLLPEPARVGRQDLTQRVLRRGVLPGEPRAPDGAAAVARLRAARRRAVRQPLRRQ